METAAQVIARLGLEPLPVEGGWFRRIAVSAERGEDGRPAWSTIHFLMTPVGFSAMHRLRLKETWEFVSGAPLELLVLGPGAEERLVTLGGGAAPPAFTVPAGAWQGARTLGDWSLVVCRVEPAWRDGDFELGDAAELVCLHPGRAREIRARVRDLTPDGADPA